MRRRALTAGIALLVAACSAETGTVELADDDRLEVFGPWTGSEADHFIAVLDGFEDETGIDTRYLGSASYSSELLRRVNDAQPPDVALIPQKGLVAELRERNLIPEVPDSITDAVESSFLAPLTPIAEVDGTLEGVPYRVSVKSLVWYSPSLFEEMGWEIPATVTELGDLTDDIEASGIAPWCVGIEAFAATGWVMTDWVEEFVLRIDPSLYDDWVDGDVGFDDDEIRTAFQLVDGLILERGRVLGNAQGLARTPVDEAVLPLVEDPPRCALHRNASFTIEWLPTGTEVGPDGDLDVFAFPPVEEDDGQRLLLGVDIAVAMTEDERGARLLEFLTTPGAREAWGDGDRGFVGGVVDGAEQADGFPGRLAQILADADEVRIDASDQMDPSFGSGSFWQITSSWAAGALSVDQVLAQLDDAREAAETEAGSLPE